MSTISDPHFPGGVRPLDASQPPCFSSSTVPRTPAFLRRRSRRRVREVLQLGGKYVHCGELMRSADSSLRGFNAPMTTEQVPAEPATNGGLEIYLRTRVLRCGCGFQMEIPA